MPTTRNNSKLTTDSVTATDDEDTIQSIITSEDFMQRMASTLSVMMKAEFHDILSKLTERIVTLEAENANLRQQFDNASYKIDALEQYSRRNNIRVYGVPEVVNENTDEVVLNICKDKLSIQLSSSDIDRSHRVGKPIPGKQRAIIVKFVRHNDKSVVFNNKSKLANSKIVIKEDLTKPRQEIYRRAATKFTFKRVWTRDGQIYARVNDTSHKITCLKDVDKLAMKL